MSTPREGGGFKEMIEGWCKSGIEGERKRETGGKDRRQRKREKRHRQERLCRSS